MRTLTILLALGVTLGTTLGACASGVAGPARNRDVLTRAEIADANLMDALDLVRAERPQWLNRRGARTMANDTDIVVYLDGSRLGGPQTLAQIPAIQIEQMRFYSEREAQFKWGTGHLHGAIEIISRR